MTINNRIFGKMLSSRLLRIMSIVIVACMLVTLAACGTTVSQQDARQTTTEYSTEAGEGYEPDNPEQNIDDGYWHDDPTEEPGSTEAPEGTITGEVAFVFPEGAESVYELYQIITNFLNNGFNYDDLNNVYDPILTYTFYSKAESDFASGLSLEESCNSMARLVSIAEEMPLPLDEYGEFEDDFIDAEAFRSELQDMEDYDDFVEELYYMIYDHSRSDGVNPFHTQQTSWEVVPEDALETVRCDFYEDFADGFEEAFPNIYEVDLGTYRGEGTDLWEMGFYCFEYNGRYYFLGFSAVLGTAGG